MSETPTTSATPMPGGPIRPSDRFVRWFTYDHLPEGPIRDTSALCARLFDDMRERLNEGPELTAGIRKLLEAKDCFVRQQIEDLDRS